ncbi:riboflavin synthase subunit alpha [Polaribacter irgensii 23-P]|jgi:riboflavin synthase|uniref:Riboflavin synthase n=1 Tax=Polaribacter irgensii 23-P TaxID=313594 RepID=A4BXR7_9FLAO|nr:riboflavin synthase [Polaribacter irgensii]EAR13758.1 riboflavin synthase subunit alpha [Polaribacter irgensii 23-P]
MFTGIIETLGEITNLVKDQQNLHITVKTAIANELKVDQSVAHNGVCLTVVKVQEDTYTVTAIKETLSKTNIGDLVLSQKVNLERGMKLGDRLDGHIVQGHVDETGVCTHIENQSGSTVFSFTYQSVQNNITIEKGSVTVNGVSLTVINSTDSSFSVAIIPYTKDNTSFRSLKVHDKVNLEFDVIGKYVSRLTQNK